MWCGGVTPTRAPSTSPHKVGGVLVSMHLLLHMYHVPLGYMGSVGVCCASYTYPTPGGHVVLAGGVHSLTHDTWCSCSCSCDVGGSDIPCAETLHHVMQDMCGTHTTCIHVYVVYMGYGPRRLHMLHETP